MVHTASDAIRTKNLLTEAITSSDGGISVIEGVSLSLLSWILIFEYYFWIRRLVFLRCLSVKISFQREYFIDLNLWMVKLIHWQPNQMQIIFIYLKPMETFLKHYLCFLMGLFFPLNNEIQTLLMLISQLPLKLFEVASVKFLKWKKI